MRLILMMLLLCLQICFEAYAQTAEPPVIIAYNKFFENNSSEKVFIHTDRPYYTNADTIWLKGYILDDELAYSRQSGLLYAELVNDTGRVVMRECLPVRDGISFGQIVLDTSTIAEGSYTLRAYTNWMQNIGADCFFIRPLYIAKAINDPWLINYDIKTSGEAAEMVISMFDHDSGPVRLRQMELKLTDGHKTWFSSKTETDLEGKLRINFNIPPKADTKRLNVTAEYVRKNAGGRKLIIPVRLNRAENIDVQFMPEGGQLVAGLTSKIAFKAIKEDGSGADISGTVLNNRNMAITSFTSMHLGMGTFTLTPAPGETYTARINVSGGGTKVFTLPQVQQQGMVLTVNSIPGRDSIVLAVQATPDMAVNKSYTVLGQSGGKICYASAINFKNAEGIVYGRVPKSRFPSGVARFTLFGNVTPVAERLVFIDHDDGLRVNIEPDKDRYHTGDSVQLAITVTDKKNNPVQGSFSLAITDDSQVKADSTNVVDIYSYMLLAVGLKGSIEQPGWYFQDRGREAALDNLLLTQGWVGYNWDKVFDANYTPAYRAEKNLAISGIVKRLNNAQAGLPVSLLTTNGGVFFRDTITDSNGRFIFDRVPAMDTPAYLIKVKDKKGKAFESYIEIDEFKAPGTNNLSAIKIDPWYINTDTSLLSFNRKQAAYKDELNKLKYPVGSKILKEVVIKGKKVIKGSHNLNGPGNADQVIDEDELISLKKMSLFDMINKGMIKGLTTDLFPKNYTGLAKMLYTTHDYAIEAKKVQFIIDGVNISNLFQPQNNEPERFEEFNFINEYLKTVTAEDIRGIEVLTNNKYSKKYYLPYLQSRAYNPMLSHNDTNYMEYAFVEITTWSGNGAFMKRKHGVAIYRSLVLSWPKTFYTPKYPVSNNTLFNLQPTLFWEPNIITNSGGKAHVTFYTKASKGKYTLIIQGANLLGNVGTSTKKIYVTKK